MKIQFATQHNTTQHVNLQAVNTNFAAKRGVSSVKWAPIADTVSFSANQFGAVNTDTAEQKIKRLNAAVAFYDTQIKEKNELINFLDDYNEPTRKVYWEQKAVTEKESRKLGFWDFDQKSKIKKKYFTEFVNERNKYNLHKPERPELPKQIENLQILRSNAIEEIEKLKKALSIAGIAATNAGLDAAIAGYDDVKSVLNANFILPVLQEQDDGIENRNIANAILLYGANGVGKSTMAQAMADQTGVKVEVISPEKNTFKKELKNALKEARQNFIDSGDKHQRTLIVINEGEKSLNYEEFINNDEDVANNVDFAKTYFDRCANWPDKSKGLNQIESAATVIFTTNYPNEIHPHLLQPHKIKKLAVDFPNADNAAAVLKFYSIQAAKELEKRGVKSFDPEKVPYKSIVEEVLFKPAHLKGGAYTPAKLKELIMSKDENGKQTGAYISYYKNPNKNFSKHLSDIAGISKPNISPEEVAIFNAMYEKNNEFNKVSEIEQLVDYVSAGIAEADDIVNLELLLKNADENAFSPEQFKRFNEILNKAKSIPANTEEYENFGNQI